MVPALVLIAAGLALFTQAPVDGDYMTHVLPVMVLFGIGAGLAFPALMTLAMSDVEPSDAGLASGLVNTTAQVGGALGLAVLATLATDAHRRPARGRRLAGRRADRRLPPGVHDRRAADGRRDRRSPSFVLAARSRRQPRAGAERGLGEPTRVGRSEHDGPLRRGGVRGLLLAAARGGDEDAYRRLVEPHSRELHAHAYRMLGSVHDAEDAVQDALLRAWRGLPRFDGRSSLRAWLYKIATNTCLDAIARRRKRALPIDHVAAAELGEAPGRPLVESVWVEPYPRRHARPRATASRRRRRATSSARASSWRSSRRCSICPPTQRAVLILREVLGFSAQETAELLETTVAVGQQRAAARAQDDRRAPARRRASRRRCARSATSGLRELVERYMDAMARGDVEAVVAMLAEDAAWSMPPLATWYRGHDALRRFLATGRCRAPGAGATARPRQRPAGDRLPTRGARTRRATAPSRLTC